MARPKKVNEATGKQFRSDRELVYDIQHCKERKRNVAMQEMWEKYFKLRMKMKGELVQLAVRNNLYMPELFEEYDSEAWIKFVEQMDGIRLEDVEHLPNWSNYIRLWGYWRSMNRDLLKKWFDWKQHTIPIYSITTHSGKGDNNNESLTNLDVFKAAHQEDDIGKDGELGVVRKAFWESIEQLKEELTPKQYQLINLKYKGAKNREIISSLKITTRVMNEQLVFIKNKLKDILKQRLGTSTVSSYNDLLEVLQ
jgi:hypothetical protein